MLKCVSIEVYKLVQIKNAQDSEKLELVESKEHLTSLTGAV